MKLIHSITVRTKNGDHQELTISADASSNEAACNLNYDDFNIHLITKHGIVDITTLIFQAGVAEGLIDSVKWPEIFADQIEEVGV